MIKFSTIKNNVGIIFVDKILRKIGYCITLEVDMDTDTVLKTRITKTI